MSEISEAELISILKKNGLKITPQRLAICNYILSSNEHPTADRIFHDIKKRNPSISHATVYKTLQLLKALGLIVELNFHNEHSHFDPNISLHVNIICPKCSKIIDFESDIITEFFEKLEVEIGGKIKGQRFEIYKICDACKL